MNATHTNSVIIADDHPIFRKGLRDIVELGNYTVLSEAKNGEEALVQYAQHCPDMIILDISMGDINGLMVAEQILTANTDALCVIMTMYDEHAFCKKALSLGVKGYLLKDDAEQNILSCLETVLAGKIFISESMGDIASFINSGEKMPEEILSDKEWLIFQDIAQLKTNKEIANTHYISVRTVQNHRQNMSVKLELSGRQALMQYAVDWFKKNNI